MYLLIRILNMRRVNANSAVTDSLPTPRTRQPQRINPPHRIRRILIKIQPTRIADWVFANKPSDSWIIVPIPIVVQPCFVIVVLPLKPDRVDQALALCPFRTLFFDFSPRAVLSAPGDLAGVVGEFLWRAEVVALVPGQHVNRQRLRSVGPQRVLVDVIGAGVAWLGQADQLLMQRLSKEREAAWFKDLMHRVPDGALGLAGLFPQAKVSPFKP